MNPAGLLQLTPLVGEILELLQCCGCCNDGTGWQLEPLGQMVAER
jgi:hypothetical protein